MTSAGMSDFNYAQARRLCTYDHRTMEIEILAQLHTGHGYLVQPDSSIRRLNKLSKLTLVDPIKQSSLDSKQRPKGSRLAPTYNMQTAHCYFTLQTCPYFLTV